MFCTKHTSLFEWIGPTSKLKAWWARIVSRKPRSSWEIDWKPVSWKLRDEAWYGQGGTDAGGILWENSGVRVIDCKPQRRFKSGSESQAIALSRWQWKNSLDET